jgi:hypothetical protein
MVSVAVPVPMVVMFKPATISIPVTDIELSSVVTRWHPSSPRIRWPSPISFMPFVVPSHWIPITVYPHELGAWSWGQNANNTWLRWRTNSDTDRHLSTKYRGAYPYHGGKQCCSDEFPHVLQAPLIALIKRSAGQPVQVYRYDSLERGRPVRCRPTFTRLMLYSMKPTCPERIISRATSSEHETAGLDSTMQNGCDSEA